jgi:diaminopimelate decarboxylase
MNLPSPGIPDLHWEDGSLRYCGLGVSRLVETTGTPAFVFSESRLRANHQLFQRAFQLPSPWRLRVAYSVKTAWEPRLLNLLAGMGTEAEVACQHELELALRAGFTPQEIFLDGPAHTLDIVAQAVELGVRFVKVDSLDQLKLVTEATGTSRKMGVCLRLKAPGSRWHGGPAEFMTDRFGMGPDELRKALALLAERPQLLFSGLAVHMGSQVTRPQAYREALKALAGAFSMAGEFKLEGKEADIGGGFPSPSLSSTSVGGLLRNWLLNSQGKVPPLEEFGNVVRNCLNGQSFPAGVTDLVVEPGRALVGNASILLTKVVAVKKGWLFLDASHNFVPESLLFASRRFLPANPRGGSPWSRTNLSGSTLSGGDVLALGSRLPQCSVGDTLVMMDAGAYTLSRANRFTTLVPPAFLLDPAGELQPLRKKEAAEDVVRESETW